ncbi:MAG: hypothetical protein M1833_002111 [Piccolia ochrophora]|nr:MAG: hypothetical protein M1833_002111 [Piccolia ochrophora]
MSSAAVSETDPSSSSTRGLSRVLEKSRRKKSKLLGPSRQGSTISTDDGSEKQSLRSSIDSTRPKGRASVSLEPGQEVESEGRTSNDSGRLQDLLARRSRKKKKKALEKEAKEKVTTEEADRGRSVAERGTLADDDDEGEEESRRSRSRSRGTKLTAPSESSLLTYDSENEPESHAGYLTLSSPLIHNASSQNAPDVPTIVEPPKHTASLPTDRSPSPSSISPKHTAAPSPNASVTDLGSQKPASSSSTSKLKEAFKINPSRRSTSPHPNPDRESNKSIGGRGGGKLGTIFGRKSDTGGFGSRTGSVASRRLSKSAEEPPTVDQGGSSPDRQSARNQSLQTPRINTSPDAVSSGGVAPVTTITPPTPTDLKPTSPTTPTPSSDSKKSPPDNSSSPTDRGASHRLTKSTASAHPPSKLSNTVSAPATPALEDPRPSTGISLSSTGSASQSGFFSSVFSAAQNAASNFSNTIASTSLGPAGRSRSGTQTSEERKLQSVDDERVAAGLPDDESTLDSADSEPRGRRPLAVETLGSGDLSLSHLGISVDPTTSGANPLMASKSESNGASNPPRGAPTVGAPASGSINNLASTPQLDVSGNAGSNPVVEGIGATSSANVSQASITTMDHNGDKPGGAAMTPVVEDMVPGMRARSTFDLGAAGEQTPPPAADWDRESGLGRSGSVRSGRSRTGLRRKRGSSATTGTTIGAAIGASNAAVANPSIQSGGPRLTGFAVASKKRNRDFHNLFKSVPEDDYLIEDYSAAIQKDILLHGRMYVAEGHICFYSNIFGYVTTMVISFDEVVSVEKKSTAVVFPNAIVIHTLHARNVFASLASRDTTYDLIIGIWKISHPNLKSSLNGVQLDQAGGSDKTVKVEESASEDSDDGLEDDEEFYDEDEEESIAGAATTSVTGSEIGDVAIKAISRKSSAIVPATNGVTVTSQANGDAKGQVVVTPPAAPDYPGPGTHAPTSCSDQDTHYDRVIKDEIIPAPLGKIYTLMFGPASGAFMTKWLRDEQKVQDLQLEDDKKGLADDKRTRLYSYIKPLTGSVGPKQTKCNIIENLDSIDLEKAVSITITTQTPDVPSGNVFSVKTKYCLMWAEGNGTRLLMNCTIEWTGKSWLKSPIEKGANDGQVTYANDIVAALRSAVTTKVKVPAGGVRGRGKRRKKDLLEKERSPRGSRHRGTNSKDRATQLQESWGLLEPLRGPLGPFVDILRPLVTPNLMLGVVTFLLMLTWARQYLSPIPGRDAAFYGGPGGRIAALEDHWQREETALWDWLDERVGLDNVAATGSGANAKTAEKLARSKLGTGMGARLASDRMGEREVDDAIKVTQERLEALKEVVAKRKRDTDASSAAS